MTETDALHFATRNWRTVPNSIRYLPEPSQAPHSQLKSLCPQYVSICHIDVQIPISREANKSIWYEKFEELDYLLIFVMKPVANRL